MRLTRLCLVLPFLVAACGQSLEPLHPVDSGVPVDRVTIRWMLYRLLIGRLR